MMRKILGRIASARSFVFAAFALAMSAAFAFDTPYLTFRSPSTFSISVWSPKWDGTMEYSTDKANWTTWTGSSISAAQSGDEYFLYLRGTGNSIVASTSWGFTGSGELVCEGDIETLRDYNGNPPPMGEKCYWMMFYGCTQLTVPPVLSATTLAAQCYNSMFQGCTSLKAIPALPATGTLPNTCYFSMFSGCSSLVVNTTGPGVEWSIPTGTTGEGIWNYSMFVNTGGDFTGNPVAGTTYYVASALPPGLSVVAGAGELAAYMGANVNFNLAETIRGGETPYAFSGTVPTGLTLNPNGMLSGSVATAGSYPFTLRVTDATSPDALTLDAEYTLVVTDPDPLAAQSNLGKAKVGKAVNIALAETISGGVPPYTFAVTASATLPTGFSLTDGVLSGTAAAAGTLTFAITATDALGTTLPASYTLEAVESAGFTDDDPEEPESGITVDCLTPDGVYPRTCNQIASSSSTVTWDNSWYYVTGNVTLSAGAIVNGKVSLILGDGATLTVQGASNKAGIGVTPGNTLSIYCQRGGSGKLIANGGTESAGIGGDNNGGSCGKVTIYGGDISAIGGSYAAGIGGGDDHGNGGIVTVYGGSVRADGGSLAAGIGGGWSPSTGDGTLTVSDNVVVKAGTSANPTAELSHGTDGSIAIVHGSHRYFLIETVGPVPLAQTTSAFAAYIDEPFEQALSGTVSGGTTPYAFSLKSGTLPTGLSFANGIVSGTPTAATTVPASVVFTVTDSASPAQSEDFTYTITVTAKPKSITYRDGTTELTGLVPAEYVEGTVVALPTTAEKAGYTLEGWYETDACTGPKVTEISASSTGDRTFWAKWTPRTYTITYMKDASTALTGLVPTSYTIEAKATLPATASNPGFGFYGWYTNSALTGTAVTEIPQGSTGDKVFYAKWGVVKSNETYIDASGSPQTAECSAVGSGTTTLESGWYAVDGNVTISSTVTVSGNAHLILKDGSKLTISVTSYDAGIGIPSGSSLTIYGQTAGSGELDVTGGSLSAGIGGGWNAGATLGAVTINGGIVTARGQSGSGIGNGRKNGGCEVVINGGVVTATCSSGAGIGGTNCCVTINGGIVTATGDGGAGIGSVNNNASAGTIVINGGTVTATGGWRAAGIGGGSGCPGAAVEIYGGTVAATGGDGAAGIGGGYGAGQGTLTVGANVLVKAGSAADPTAEIGQGGSITLGGQRYFATETTGPVALAQKTGAGALSAVRGDAANWTLSDTIVGGTPPYTFAAKTGHEPPAFLSLAGGVLSGTPTAAGTYNFTLVVTDDVSDSIEADYTLVVREVFGITYKDQDGVTNMPLQPSVYTNGIGVATLPRPTKAGWAFVNWYDNAGLAGSPVTSISSSDTGAQTLYSKWEENLSGTVPMTFLDADGSTRTENCVVIDATTTTLDDGWYVVANDVAPNSKSLTVSGHARLVLRDGKTLTLTGANNKAGIEVTSGNALTIYGQSLGTGALSAKGMYGSAGIGGSRTAANCGTVTVNGGTVAANGGDGGAGIGGGKTGNGGTVAVNGGTVTATGFTALPGVGKGDGGADHGTLQVGAYMSVTAGNLPKTMSAKTPDANGFISLAGERYYTFASVRPVPVSYRDADGSDKTTNCVPLSASVSTLSDGWYAVTKDLALSAGLTVSGNAKLVLVDGVTLTVAGYSTPGVEVTVGNSLTIYGQVDGTGALIVSTTAGLCAGIGAGNGVAGGAVTINGGSVQATGGDSGGAGIGGGSHGAGGTVVINGGSVVATGGGGGAGIGGGQYGAGGTVTVNGGTVTATSGTTTGSYLAAGIGCGLFGGNNQGALIVASGLTVHAGASADPAGVPSRDSVTGSVTLGGEPYYVITESSGAAEYGIVYMSNGTPLNLAPASYFAGTGVAELPVPPAESTPAGRMFGGWYANDDFSGEAVTSIPSDAEELKTFYAKWGAVPVPVTYIDGNGDPQQASCIVVNEFSTELTNGWYVLEESLTFTSSLTILGDVKLVLKDDKTLTVIGTNNRAGVVVMGANALTLYAQSIGAGAGALVARGNNSAAGIGGNEGGSGGSVTIYGGNVTATGGDMLVPGIGGGWHGAGQGTLTVAPWLSVKAGASADPEEILPKSASGVVALANRQYYKVVEASRYNITYMDGANVLQNLEPSSYAEGAGATLATPAAASGFAFVGWYTNATFAGEATMKIPASASGDKTFYAKWAASESTPYVDANGDGQTMDCVVLTADMTNLIVGSYVAKGTLAFGTGGITVAGDVTIVLADGAQMSVAGGEQKAGISVPAGCSLTIYAQEQGTGALDATCGNLAAGIGGDYRASAGTVTVYGGTVTATGDSRGIGGGVYAADNGRLVLGPGMLAKAGFDALHVDLLPANETTGEVIVSGDSRYFRIEKSEEEILPLTQVTGTFDATNGINVAWTLADTVCYGTKPYSFALKAGSSLPDGFTFEDGVLSGAPTASGNYPFTMVVTDGASPEPQVLEATYTIRASANPNQLTQIVSDLPDAIAGFEYYQALGQTIEGGKKPYTFTQKEAMGCYPPPGIKLKGAALSGIPTDPGRITTVTLVVTDANGLSTEATYNLNVEAGFVQTFTANGVEWKFALFSNPNTHQDRVVICDNNGPAIDRATEGAIVIPSSYGRTSPVACLGDMAFYLCTNLTSVTIPNGVLAIGDMAFASCSNLVSVRIPSSVVQMGDWVFDESGLETVYVDPGDVARVRGLIEGTDYDVSGLAFIEVCDVAFNANYDGGAATTNMMRYGQAVGTLPVLAREHYTFLGWFTAAEGGEQISAETQVTQNATYYAHWAIDTFTVTFAKNDGTDAVVESRRVAYGERVGTLPADPTRDGYTFFHWWTEPGNNAGTTASALTTVTADVTYYAHWNPRSYTVRFLKNDGTETVVMNSTKSFGQTLGTLPTPTRDGYTLAGWFTAAEGGEQIDPSTLVEGDIDYYAHWTPDSVEDWPADTSTVAGQTAGEAFEITGDLANVNAKTLADWAKGAGNVAYGDKDDIIPEAFLMNCANTAAAVATATVAAKAAIKITAITIVNGVPQLTYPATYGNGQVVIRGSATIGSTASWHDGKQTADRFFKTVLRLKPSNE